MNRALDWTRGPKDARDFGPEALLKAVALPPAVDNTHLCSGVDDQLSLGGCTGHAMTAVLEYNLRKHGLDLKLSRLLAYYNGRRLMGTVKEDSGCYMRTVVKAAKKFGVCTEPSWPYVVEKFADKPTVKAYSEASDYQVLKYAFLDSASPAQTLYNIKLALAQGLGVVGGFDVCDGFMGQHCADTGIAPGFSGTGIGGHAVSFFGYSEGMLLAKNSWGKDWGRHGYFLLPESYVLESHASDFIALESAEIGINQRTWIGNAWHWLWGGKDHSL